MVPCRPYPLGWHADELEHEGFDAAGLLWFKVLRNLGFTDCNHKFKHMFLLMIVYAIVKDNLCFAVCHLTTVACHNCDSRLS